MGEDIHLWIELSNQCNLRCKFCYYDFEHYSRYALPYDILVSRLAQSLKELPITSVAVSGGEPLLHSRCLEFVEFLSRYSVELILTSNGLLLDQKRIDRLSAAGLQVFQIPLHSDTPVIHNYLAGAGSWEQALACLYRVKESGGIPVPVFVATDINYRDAVDVVEITAIFKLKKLILNRYIPTALHIPIKDDVLRVQSDQLFGDVLLKVNAVAEQFDINIQPGTPLCVSEDISQRLTKFSHNRCPVQYGSGKYFISSDGEVKQCVHLNRGLGNLRNQPLSTIISRSNQLSHYQAPGCVAGERYEKAYA